ncbi:hypothetical protein ACFOOM_13110 [Streptomyces echinoruber]|nr:hypothetical protein [Streptomyces echinoruber]
MEFARFLGLPVITPRHHTTDATTAVCQVLIEARTDLVLDGPGAGRTWCWWTKSTRRIPTSGLT